MKRSLSALLLLCLLLALSACAPQTAAPAAEASAPVQTAVPAPTPVLTPDPATPVVFADPVLEEHVRAAMDRPDGDITLADALTVTRLDLSMDGNDWSAPRIRDLEGLQAFSNLTFLGLNWALYNDRQGVDLTPLAGLTKLEGLYLCCDEIYDISPLAGLVNMRDLWIWGCSLTDIRALSGMTKMDSLWIKNNYISDLSPLAGMTNLSLLYMEDNVVSDLTPLAGLTGLSELTLARNLVSDYSVLSGISAGLTQKDFEPDQGPQPIAFNDAVLEQRVRELLGKPDGDITVADTRDVTELTLGNQWQETIPEESKIKDISALKYFPGLYKLELMFNDVKDIRPILAMPRLGILDLNGNPLRDLVPVAGCPELTWLNLAGGHYSDLRPLEGLSRLEWLSLSYTPDLRDIGPLAALTGLKTLYLEDDFVDLSPLAGLTNLTTLYVSPSGGQDLSVLKDIYPNLTDKNFEMP